MSKPNGLRIAFIVEAFPRLSETFILNQVLSLLKEGHQVDFPFLSSQGKANASGCFRIWFVGEDFSSSIIAAEQTPGKAKMPVVYPEKFQ